MENWGEQTRLVFRLAVGLYLIYMAYKLIATQLGGGSDMPDWAAYAGGGILGLAGAAFCVYSLFRYFKQCRANREKKPDPPAPEDEL